MSFYGNIKRVNSSPFIFDRYYPNRKAMIEACSAPEGDGVYVGRYVLIKYTCRYLQDDDGNIYIDYFDQYIKDEDSQEKIINPLYEANANIDLNMYGDTYNETIWQKVYTHVNNENSNAGEEKYILIAELKAAVPRIKFESISPKEIDSNGVESWKQPSINPSFSSEDAFTVTMPNPLHLEVEQLNGEDFYGSKLIENPAVKSLLDIDISNPPSDYDNSKEGNWNDLTNVEKKHRLALSSDYNKMEWTNYYLNSDLEERETLVPPGGDIDIKRLKAKFYAFGQMISDMYDIMYGAPVDGSAGMRPFYTSTDLADLLSNYDKGLIGILTSIATEAKGDASEDLYGRELETGLHYYFVSKWCDASEDSSSFIENIPNVIGASSNAGGNGAESQYYIDFSDQNGNYIKSF